MTQRIFTLIVLIGLIAAQLAAAGRFVQAQASPRYPFPQHLPYAPGTIKPNQRSQTQLDDDVRAFYDHWKANYLIQAGTTGDGHPLYRVSFGSTNPGRTVSEGQGYGMIIVALMAGYDPEARTIFDGLWEFARQNPSDIDARLMDWEWFAGDGPDASAFDGDADIAYGLLLAEAQWSNAGRIDYHAAAETVIAGILESTIGPDSRLPMLGDWTQPNGNPYNQYTPRSSDFMPSHFQAYGRATNNPVWITVVANSQAVITSLQQTHSPVTGLLPDFIVNANGTPQPAAPNFLEGPNDGYYNYNAGRDPWRIGLDVLLNDDPVSRAQAQKMSTWIETSTGGDPQKIQAGYQLDGTPLADYFTSFFAAPFGVAAMTNPAQQQWLNNIYDSVYDRHEDYYEDSVTLLTLLVMTGNFWDPTTIANGSHFIYLPTILKTGQSPSGALWQPPAGTRWWWQLENTATLDPNLAVDVYDIDLFEGEATGMIQTLKNNGYRVICYFSAGSYEPFRVDMEGFNPAALLNPVEGFEEERWLDIRSSQPYLAGDIKPVMAARLQKAADLGCDAVEPDNVDAWANTNGVVSQADQLSYNRWLAASAHALGLSTGLKNDLEQIGDLLDDFDFAVNEQCYAYDECEVYLTTFLARNKAVFNQEYGGSGGGVSQTVYTTQACPYFRSNNISSLWKAGFNLDGNGVLVCHP